MTPCGLRSGFRIRANPRAMGFWAEAGFEPYMLTFRTFAST